MALRPDWLVPLSAFEAAARHQNFARAAEELHLTASAVSHHVRRLEERLGMVLFQRHARGVTLTAEGRRLADAASSAFADVEGALQRLKRGRDEGERVRLTALHSWAQSWLIPRLPGFFAAHPGIRLRLETEIALTRFDDVGPDLGIRHGPGHWQGLSAIHLMPDALFPVVSPDLRARTTIESPADIARLPLIADLTRQGWSDWFRAAGLHGARVDERFIVSDSIDALRAAASGIGAALARETIVAPWIARRELVALPGPVLPTRWEYYIVFPEHRPLRPAAREFVDWLVAEARKGAVLR